MFDIKEEIKNNKYKPIIKIYNGCCFEKLKNIQSNTVDLFILDLPYGETNCTWDIKLNLNKLWEEIKRIKTKTAYILFFCSFRFGFDIINSNYKWFNYDLIWIKSKKTGFLNCNKVPLRKHEIILVFSDYKKTNYNINQNKELRVYSEKIYNFINKPKKEIFKIVNNQGLDHFFRFNSSQFSLPTKKNYILLCEHFKINKEPFYIDYEELKKKYINNNRLKTTYNPVKSKGTPYNLHLKEDKKTVDKKEDKIYNNKYKINKKNTTGDRFPVSVLEFKSVYNGYHPTEKPVDLLKYLISLYSNPGAVVCDFTMGCGSCAVASINLNRSFIGIEKNKDFFNISYNRIIKNRGQYKIF